MQLSNEHKACLWLSEANVSTNLFEKLLKTYSSAYEIFLNYDLDKHQLFTNDQIKALDMARDSLNSNIDAIEQNDIHMIIYDSPEYPTKLKSINDAPYALYYKGNLNVLNRPCIAIVGTRKPSFYGKKIAKLLSEKLSSAGACVVSGMAIGIDTYAHQGAVNENSASTCAVCGCGLNIDYPASNRDLKENVITKGGLLISEYTPNTVARNYFFPYRNRIISGLSDSVVFVEGEVRSGGMLTVDRAIEQGRNVYAVPGNIDSRFSSGPNYLLNIGEACCINDIDYFVESLNLPSESNFTKDDNIELEGLKPFQIAVLKAIQQESMSVDQLVLSLNMNIQDVQVALAKLEILGYIQRAGGGTYSIS